MSNTPKYILQLTLPNGQKMNASRVKDKFALIPDKSEGAFLIWDTKEEVNQFLIDIRERNPEKYKVIWEMNPAIVPVLLSPVGIVRPFTV